MDLGLCTIENVNTNLQSLNDQLYSSVMLGDYDNAVVISLVLEKLTKGAIIKSVVNRLLENSVRNLTEYAYKLLNCGGRNVLVNHFPIEFRLICSEENLKLVDKRDNFALKLSVHIDGDGNREAWGDSKDKSSNRVVWKLISIWEQNRVYFKIFNIETNMYLKSALANDNIGDRRCYGSSDADTNRHQWYLHPVKHNENIVFFIFNRRYNQALKLARDVDNIGDRPSKVHYGLVTHNPENYGWCIMP